ncbi:ribosomal RNA processing protein 1 homolog [Plodia interpunctella]|uniref:ribosomal RNA processing protein 1 homolog n=1 Tax=Plodia interpunctella TaxID=58824 RepID=UPI002367F688|nr:ribosomal RNA processing protein 1 homolog [Plodia interpunctella]
MRNKNKNISKMKPSKKLNMKSQKIKKKPIAKPKKQDVLIVAQEIKFARLLAGNEKKSRDRVLKTLKKWLVNCFQKGHEFKEEDFIRLWKGLFYAVWMSDKPLVQEELCENISGILDQFPPEQVGHAIMMVKAGFRVLATEWYGIDQHRMDKFLMLVRRYLRGSLRCLLRCEWSLDACKKYSKMLTAPDGILALKTPHYARNATSMVTHFIECFLEELAKVSSGSLPASSTAELLQPFVAHASCGAALSAASRRLLAALLRQSEAGLRYAEATRAWHMMGCPRGGPEAMQLVVDDDDDEDSDGEDNSDDDGGEKPLDPRAGRVHVSLASLRVPAAEVAGALRDMLPNTASKAHRRTKIYLERFEKLAKNEYPLPVEEVYEEDETPATWQPTRAAKELRNTERALVEQADELALRGLSRKHRRRLLARTRAGLSIVEDVALLYTNGDWTIESTETESADTSNKENVQNKSKKRKRKDTQTDTTKKQKVDEATRKIKAEKKKNDRKINMLVNKRDNKLKKIQKDLAMADSIKNFFENRSKKEKTDNSAKGKVKNEPKTIKMVEKPTKVVEKPTKVGESPTKAAETPAKVVEKPTKVNEKPTKAAGKVTKVVEKSAKVAISVEKVENVKQNVDTAMKTTVVAKKVKNFQKQTTSDNKQELQKIMALSTPKRVKFALKNNTYQQPAQYRRLVRAQPALPYDAARAPARATLKPAPPAHRNPFTRTGK